MDSSGPGAPGIMSELTVWGSRPQSSACSSSQSRHPVTPPSGGNRPAWRSVSVTGNST